MVIGEWITFYINNTNVIKNVFNMSIYDLDKIENNPINMKLPLNILKPMINFVVLKK
jgi:hypothetical protein